MLARTWGNKKVNISLVGMPIATATLENILAAFKKIENACIIRFSDISPSYRYAKEIPPFVFKDTYIKMFSPM